MKRTLLTKIFLGFLLFGLFGFLIVATFTSKLSFDKLKHDEVTNLTEAASSVADVLNSHTEERLILSKEEKIFIFLSEPLFRIPYLDLKKRMEPFSMRLRAKRIPPVRKRSRLFRFTILALPIF